MPLRKKQLKHYFLSVGLLILAVALSITTNATGLLATKEYADWSTRGKSELTINPDGSPKEASNGLDKEYITQYSYGISESLNLFAPRLFGGSGNEDLGTSSKAYEYLINQGVPPNRAIEFSRNLPLYWGDQPIVAAPAYVGAIVFFLFVLGLFLVKGKRKWWLAFGALLSLVLSWGKNFPELTNFMIDYFPLYNKFRAVSSIQVVLELCVPVLGILGLREIFRAKIPRKNMLKALKWSGFIILGLVVLIFVLMGVFDFDGIRDEFYRQQFWEELVTMIKRDREAVYINDTIRSLIYVALAAFVIWLLIKEKINKNMATVALGVLILFDLVGVATRYVNEDDFVRQRQVNTPFQPSQIDNAIQKDKAVYRVFDPQEGINGARTSYFHKSIGGYHAAKPKRLQDLFEYHLYQNNTEVLDMLNVKYVIQQDAEGNNIPAINDNRNGNAWFVERIIPVKSSNEEIQALSSFTSKREAVVNTQTYPRLTMHNYEVDSLAKIELVDYRPNLIKYRSENNSEGFAVFSEMHYPKGWKVTIDGNPEEHFRVNYALRGLRIPEGQHDIVFEFEPEVIQMGSQISLASCIALAVIILGGFGFSLFSGSKKKKNKA